MRRIRVGVIGTGFGVRVQIPGFLESGEFATGAGASGAEATAALRAMELPPFVCLARELAGAIRDGRTREPSVADAARTQEVCEAIERSAREGRWLALPL